MYESSVQTTGPVFGDCRPQHSPGIVTRETEMRQVCSRPRSSFPVASAVQTLRVSLIDVAGGHPPASPVLTLIHNMHDDVSLLHMSLDTWVIKQVPCVDAPKSTATCSKKRHR